MFFSEDEKKNVTSPGFIRRDLGVLSNGTEGPEGISSSPHDPTPPSAFLIRREKERHFARLHTPRSRGGVRHPRKYGFGGCSLSRALAVVAALVQGAGGKSLARSLARSILGCPSPFHTKRVSCQNRLLVKKSVHSLLKFSATLNVDLLREHLRITRIIRNRSLPTFLTCGLSHQGISQGDTIATSPSPIKPSNHQSSAAKV